MRLFLVSIVPVVMALGQSLVKTGDQAPGIAFTRLLHAPDSAEWKSGRLLGKTSVIAFFPDTSHNASSVAKWNALVQEFAAKPVQFIWITREEPGSLEPWLKQHPIGGWVFLDFDWDTAKAYGIEWPQAAIVDANRQITGFTSGFLPTRAELDAMLEGRIEKAGLAVQPQPFQRQPADPKPGFAPSYEVHISPTSKKDDGVSTTSRPDYWTARGFGLKEIIAKLYKVDESRVILPASVDTAKRYDFALVLPKPEDDATLDRLVGQAVQKHFSVTIRREKRLMDVYVMTAPNGKSAALKAVPETDSGGGYSFSIRGASVSAGHATMQDFAQMLAEQLGLLVVDETGLPGRYDFEAQGSGRGDAAFLKTLHEMLGLDLTRDRREVDMVVVEKLTP